ncbi:MAG: leucine-rich repeat domain-containing protein, partial [Ruminococcus sp.]|nr:leucine-rich repeat domain-containing protein [Ruminococcus sp.]
MKILPISDEFKAHLEERYQNINRDYYGQDIESSELNIRCADYNSPTPQIGTRGQLGNNIYFNNIPPFGILDDSIYKWTANKLAGFAAISVMCPETKTWTVEYIEPFRRENYPIAITTGGNLLASSRISGRYCINSNIIDSSFDSNISKGSSYALLGFNHITYFNYSDICMCVRVIVVDDESITNFEESHKTGSPKDFYLHDYFEGWYDEAAGMKNYQKYPNILRLYVSQYMQAKSEKQRDSHPVCIQTRWHARNLEDWKQYMTHHTDYNPSFISDKLVQDASQSSSNICISGATDDFYESFVIQITANTYRLDTTPEGTFTQRTAYKSGATRYVDNGFLKPVDVLVHTAVNMQNDGIYCLPYMRCEDFTKEKMLREAAYLGFWFTDNLESAQNSELGENCADPHIYCPIFDEDFVTTGEYLGGAELEQKGAFKNASHLEKVYIPETVKKIGDESFAGTALKSVKISADCEYSATSFPAECRIEFYGKSGEYGQLLDSGEREILDSTAARIYIRSENMADEKLRI